MKRERPISLHLDPYEAEHVRNTLDLEARLSRRLADGFPKRTVGHVTNSRRARALDAVTRRLQRLILEYHAR